MKRHIPTTAPFDLRQGYGGQVVPDLSSGIVIASTN